MAKDAKVATKLNPFKYPHKKHTRTQKPPVYRRYSSYRRFLELEFGKRCVYCRRPILKEQKGLLHIDHYCPQAVSEDLVCDYNNLYLSCSCCNGHKDDYWPRIVADRIVNPCDFVMSTHLKYVGSRVEWLSRNGQVTVDRLMINSEESTELRETLSLKILAMVGLFLKLTKAKPKQPSDKVAVKAQMELCLKWLSSASCFSEEECAAALKI